MKTIFLDDFLINGILKEKAFNEKVNKLNWDEFIDKRVLIKGCTNVPVPTWAYLIITARLSQKAKRIYFGEIKRPIEIYNREKSND
ncbi:MAG: hypothetical protein CMG08_04890 [Candidatus Marinimicrobia bacterium]|nr:hypothetical protein [Candidatus Neomarinimicrobiota bacterium]